MEPAPPSPSPLGRWSPDHWATREVPILCVHFLSVLKAHHGEQLQSDGWWTAGVLSFLNSLRAHQLTIRNGCNTDDRDILVYWHGRRHSISHQGAHMHTHAHTCTDTHKAHMHVQNGIPDPAASVSQNKLHSTDAALEGGGWQARLKAKWF